MSEKVRSDRLELRLDPNEKAAFERAAELSGLTLSGWVRERLRRLAKEELETAGERAHFIPRSK
ncbi:type II toxin -antitoxin system TacA 1-like antitoxin [Anatilimnocola floriformis]|uniref:type II toxin -antitoxin system TacA 1-like antitoxin n=1 Tax=Anatilimnocola floriformis TaxID=2948575 RepID=UPI0020C50FB1|nr:DUF1778 domain-containing protein [Anatilimnocola floriformis]